MTETFRLSRIPTPVGDMLIAVDDEDRLRVLDWDSHIERMERLMERYYGPGAVALAETDAGHPTREKLLAYVAGDVAAIEDIAATSPGTAFQQKVWAALREIPAGQTWSYGRLAAHVGDPGAARAVGLANGSNPIGVVVPCHRVIGADGTLTGYGGGIERKRWLLRHEGAVFKDSEPLLL
ncbi:MAG: methylated-DNA--[protein]-cysteine S-methyltransferase [Caulobacteraceae bacterium]